MTVTMLDNVDPCWSRPAHVVVSQLSYHIWFNTSIFFSSLILPLILWLRMQTHRSNTLFLHVAHKETEVLCFR